MRTYKNQLYEERRAGLEKLVAGIVDVNTEHFCSERKFLDEIYIHIRCWPRDTSPNSLSAWSCLISHVLLTYITALIKT